MSDNSLDDLKKELIQGSDKISMALKPPVIELLKFARERRTEYPPDAPKSLNPWPAIIRGLIRMDKEVGRMIGHLSWTSTKLGGPKW